MNPKTNYVSNKPVTKIQVTIELEGYRDSITQEYTLTVGETKPTISVNRGSTVFYTKDERQDDYISNSLIFTDSIKGAINPSIIEQDEASKAYVTFENQKFKPVLREDRKTFASGNKKEATVKFTVNDPSWLTPLSVIQKVS